MNEHPDTSELAAFICETVAELGRPYPWAVRLEVTYRLVEAFSFRRPRIVSVECVVYARAAQARLHGEPLVPRTRGELEELRAQFGPGFAAFGFDNAHAIVMASDFAIEVADADDVSAGLMPLEPRVIPGPWLPDSVVSVDLPLGCVAAYRISQAAPPEPSIEHAMLARRLEIRAAARVRWLLDGPSRRYRSA